MLARSNSAVGRGCWSRITSHAARSLQALVGKLIIVERFTVGALSTLVVGSTSAEELSCSPNLGNEQRRFCSHFLSELKFCVKVDAKYKLIIKVCQGLWHRVVWIQELV